MKRKYRSATQASGTTDTADMEGFLEKKREKELSWLFSSSSPTMQPPDSICHWPNLPRCQFTKAPGKFSWDDME